VQYVAENALFIFTPGFLSINCGAVSDEHGKRFHQDISAMEQDKWSSAILGDYFWMKKRDFPGTKFHRQAKRTLR